MSTPTDVQSAEHAARRLLDARRDEKIVSVRELALARQAKVDAAAAADAADRADAAAWATALKHGWTEADLREVGFDAPTRRTPGRPRRMSPGRKRSDLVDQVPAQAADAAAAGNGAVGSGGDTEGHPSA